MRYRHWHVSRADTSAVSALLASRRLDHAAVWGHWLRPNDYPALLPYAGRYHHSREYPWRGLYLHHAAASSGGPRTRDPRGGPAALHRRLPHGITESQKSGTSADTATLRLSSIACKTACVTATVRTLSSPSGSRLRSPRSSPSNARISSA